MSKRLIKKERINSYSLPANVIVFDSQCVLCDRWVRFVVYHDKRAVFYFASVHSETGSNLLRLAGLDQLNPESMLFMRNGHIYSHTDAILRVLWQLGGPWRFSLIMRILPAFIRDPLYVAVAKRRYQWFGTKETCLMPQNVSKSRFLS